MEYVRNSKSKGIIMIPVCTPFIGEKEREYVLDCIDTNWISSQGKYVEKFEEGFSSYCGCEYGVSTTNGTTALHLALASLGIKNGDEVIVPTFTIASCIFSILYTGAKPVLVDSDPETWTIDVNQIEDKITKNTKAIMPVHIYGHPCDMDPIMDLAEDNDLYIVEDAAEAHGAEYKGKKCGGIGDIGCFSFYANKIITTGEGGMVVTNDEKIAEKARSLKDLAFSKERRFLHDNIGFNYRMTNIQAAIGLAQLEKIDELVEMRRNNAKIYNKYLKKVKGLKLPIEKSWAKNVYWMYSILVENDYYVTRDKLIMNLGEKRIQTRTFFIPMHKQPIFHNKIFSRKEYFPISENISEKGMYLPSSSNQKLDEIKLICKIIERADNE